MRACLGFVWRALVLAGLAIVCARLAPATELSSNFPTTEPGANGIYSVDFARQVPAGATLAAAVWALAVEWTLPGSTVDATPSSRLVGSPSISGTISSQRIAGCVAGNDYLVTVTGTMSDAEIVQLWTTLPCRAPQ